MTETILNNSLKWGGVAALIASTLAISGAAEAISLIGNYSSTNDGASLNLTGANQGAVGFTLPTGTDYQLNAITLRLSSYNTSVGDAALLQIYADTAKTSTNPLGATLQPLSFTNPSFSSDVAGDFIFTPTSTFTFTADTRYWLLVDVGAGAFGWTSNNPAITPTGISGIVFDGTVRSNNNGTSYTSGGINRSFDISVTPVTVGQPHTFLNKRGWV
jgi:hypothetical protein